MQPQLSLMTHKRSQPHGDSKSNLHQHQQMAMVVPKSTEPSNFKAAPFKQGSAASSLAKPPQTTLMYKGQH